MKHILTLLFLTITCPFATAQSTEEDAVKKVINTAYVEGIHNRGSIDEIRKGFHPTFNMLRLVDNDIKPYPIEEWIAAIEKSRASNEPLKSKTEGKFTNVDVTGNAAVAELELFREGKKIFTDYLVLYKFNEGWRIVSKTFYRHP